MRRIRVSPRYLILGALVVILTLGLVSVLILSRFNQDVRQQAASSGGITKPAYLPSNQMYPAGTKVTTDLVVSTQNRQVDGVQVIYRTVGTLPADLAFTPNPNNGLDLAVPFTVKPSTETSVEGPVNTFSLGFVTKNPSIPLNTQTQTIKLGTLTYTAGSNMFYFNQVNPDSKIIEHTTLTDLMLASNMREYTFDPAPAPSPSVSPTPGPINWQTTTTQLSAAELAIKIGTKTFYGKPDAGTAMQLHSDPGSATYTTLEAMWTEQGIPMRLFLYFSRSLTTGLWRVTEMRTYNGTTLGGWLYYPGTAFGQALAGQSTNVNLLTIASDTGASLNGTVSMKTMNLRSFINASPIPSPSIIVSPIPTPTPSPSPRVCTQDVKQCPDGSFVSRSVALNCQFLPCPSPVPSPTAGVTPSPSAKPSPTPSACTASPDINGDGKINIIDYSALLAAYVGNKTNTGADLNCDGKINLLDYSILLNAYRQS